MTQAYTTVSDADDYFATRFAANRWLAANPDDKLRALTTATQIINRLNFVGLKAAAYVVKRAGGTKAEIRAAGNTQENQFPRNDDTEVPVEIEQACCEIAYALISGIDPDKELRSLATASESIGPLGLKVTYDRTRAAEWIMAGVPSPTAWQLLQPYLRDLSAISIL